MKGKKERLDVLLAERQTSKQEGITDRYSPACSLFSFNSPCALATTSSGETVKRFSPTSLPSQRK